MATAAQIRYYRRLRNMSQEELALKANLNPAYFGQIERGLKCPTIDTLNKISKALEISLPELFRFNSSSEYAADYLERLQDLINRIPPEKMEHVLKIIDDITGLF